MKKFIKYVIGISTLIFVVIIVAAAVFISKLPSANEIHQKIVGTPKAATSSPAQQERSSIGGAQQPAANESLATTEATEESKSKEQGANKFVTELIFDPQKPLADICDHLAEATRSPMFGENQRPDFFADIVKAATENATDPFVNAVFAPVRFAMRLPTARKFFDEVREAELNGEQNLMEKVGFYAKGLAAYNEMQSSNTLINNVANHAYYLFLMAQVVKKNPQIAQIPEAQAYCQQIQQGLVAGMSFDSERAAEEMLKFLDYAHVSPEEIKFDPHFRSDVKIEFTNHAFKMGFGWVGRYLN